MAYAMACLGIEKNGHVTDGLPTSNSLRFFNCADAPALREGQTRREAGPEATDHA